MQTFPSECRLKNRKEFHRTLNDGIKIVCSEMVLVAQRIDPNSEPAAHTRLGLIASKKVGNAVVRNRVKRNIRESFRILKEDIEQNTVLKGIDLVVIARAKAAQVKQGQMQSALEQSIYRLVKKMNPKSS